MKPQIIVCVFNNLATDQRVTKMCNTLFTHGFPILLVGSDWKGKPNMQRDYPFHRIHLVSKSLKTAYAEFQWKLYHFLQKNSVASTIILANDLDLLYACFLFSKKNKIPLVYDSHEIFTEMPDVQGRFSQKVWRFLEQRVIREIPYRITACKSYADWFARKYQIEAPMVLNNYPNRTIVQEDKMCEKEKKVIIYQGVVKKYRGIDLMIEAIRFLPQYILWVVGDGPMKDEYERLAKEMEVKNVVFYGNVHPLELKKLTLQADLGLSLEENAGLSYYYSLPNKVLDYIQALVPVLGNDYPETGRIIHHYKVGLTIEKRTPEHIAEKIKEILSKPKSYYLDNLKRASAELCWENQEKELISFFDKISQER
ncbi:glycosyltransferase [Elizabethkingia sp. JS20170427COW]|uniref:glycosyltransferase n=1 Tax=Elizabethkingia sp. JS20170427COW TaxID=2583851 RepID=UPI0011104284|nr:glycosyltransferase [Elizabethkingia sp. JS20170427COW]QCX53003.1 glycosyltransferase family 4 protein [Elizabethkingia sp. JS20170427COW]